jgi:hypothetical protein
LASYSEPLGFLSAPPQAIPLGCRCLTLHRAHSRTSVYSRAHSRCANAAHKDDYCAGLTQPDRPDRITDTALSCSRRFFFALFVDRLGHRCTIHPRSISCAQSIARLTRPSGPSHPTSEIISPTSDSTSSSSESSSSSHKTLSSATSFRSQSLRSPVYAPRSSIP